MNAALINLFSLKDKIALVTGANTGIGLAIAEGLAEAGAHILAANRNREEGEAAVREMVDKGYQADFYPVDVSEKKSIDDLFAWVEKNYGTLDILVNNAGINRMKKIMDFNDDDWEAVMNVDLRGTFYCSKAAFPLMKEKGGKIINLGSITAYKCLNNGSSTYSVGKSGVNKLTQVCAVEWAPYKTIVNAIAPGVCITRINKDHYDKHPDLLKRVSAGIPEGRVSVPEDYKGIAVFLASSASDYMTGQILYMDGGMSLV